VNAVSSGVRSPSVDQRDSVIVSAPTFAEASVGRPAVAALVIVARRLSAAVSLDAVRPTPASATTTAMPAAPRIIR